MNSRERQLAEGLKNFLFGIQKSQQIYKEYAHLGKEIHKMTEKQIEDMALVAASIVDKWFDRKESLGEKPSKDEVQSKIEEVLKSFTE